MAAAILNQGFTAIRNQLKQLITHVGVSTDSTAFNANQTTLNPGGGTNLIKTSTETDVDFRTFDAQISINGDTEFTNQTINTIGVLQGPNPTDALTRTVRTGPIGVQPGDLFTIGVRIQNQDNS